MMDDTNFHKYFDDVAQQADAIHFDISMVDPKQSKLAGLDFELNVDGTLKTGNVTSVELNRILANQDLLDKTTFYGYNSKGEFGKLDNDLVKKNYGSCK